MKDKVSYINVSFVLESYEWKNRRDRDPIEYIYGSRTVLHDFKQILPLMYTHNN